MPYIYIFSPYPEDGLEFTTLWCRQVHASVDCWQFKLRDYPTPWLDIQDLHIWGRLVGAEQMPTKRGRLLLTLYMLSLFNSFALGDLDEILAKSFWS